MPAPENGITIEFTNYGKVREFMDWRIDSTSHEAQVIIEKLGHRS